MLSIHLPHSQPAVLKPIVNFLLTFSYSSRLFPIEITCAFIVSLIRVTHSARRGFHYYTGLTKTRDLCALAALSYVSSHVFPLRPTYSLGIIFSVFFTT
jgi:hypothetical protein